MLDKTDRRAGSGTCPFCENMGMICSPGSHDTMYMQGCQCGCPVKSEPFTAMMLSGVVLGTISAVGLLALIH
ncbi:hypothetical protein FHS99_000455 [Sphingomonas prati]|uniref:Uncharacterized protein n=1 Tax=Sphingomonas prati TaxID=1843237 RepID=A0A7W9F1Q1_9SPHN|nr:hypothetical protein [Sphingomonas prati]